MKRLAALALALTVLTGCDSKNEYGACEGFGNRKPDLEYKVSMLNGIVAFVFFETAVVPIVWALDYAYCPVGPVKK